MRIVFRADASLETGTGHIVRCESLADELRKAGHSASFCCRELSGNLISWLKERGHDVTVLSTDDAAETHRVAEKADWLIVDNYNLDFLWERKLRNSVVALFVLDDLGRKHDCDMLLDQNYSNSVHYLYAQRVPPDCELLLGPKYALVRPQFSELRSVSLAQDRGRVSRILVFMGGIDEQNETTKALRGIAFSRYANSAVEVVIGQGNPHKNIVEAACGTLSNVRLHVQTNDMARLMASSDLMICGGGSVTWERCTLGVPALVTVLADNQKAIVESLDAVGAHRSLGSNRDLAPIDYAAALDAITFQLLASMSTASASLCDGNGVSRVVQLLDNKSEPGEAL